MRKLLEKENCSKSVWDKNHLLNPNEEQAVSLEEKVPEILWSTGPNCL